MSAFCVFGMTEALAKKAAERAWKKHLEGLAHDVRKHLTPEDEAEWIKVKTEYFLAKGKPVPVSAPFDAPPSSPGISSALPAKPCARRAYASCAVGQSSTRTAPLSSVRPPRKP